MVPNQSTSVQSLDAITPIGNMDRRPEPPSEECDVGLDSSKNDLSGIKVRPKEKTYGFWILISALFITATVNLTLLSLMKFEDDTMLMGLPAHESVIFGNVELESLENLETILSEQNMLLETRSAEMNAQDTDLHSPGSDMRTYGVELAPESREQNAESKLTFSLLDENHREIRNVIAITPDELNILGVDNFEIVDPKNGNILFSTDTIDFPISDAVENVETDEIRISALLSRLDSPLTLKSEQKIYLDGNEGVSLRGKETHLTSNGGSINLESRDGDVFLLADNVELDFASYQFIVNDSYYNEQQENVNHFQLCVCMPRGIVFKAPVLVNSSNNESPCEDAFYDLAIENLCA